MSGYAPIEQVIQLASDLHGHAIIDAKSDASKVHARWAKDLIENRPNLVHTTSMLGTARASFDCAAYKLLESALNVYKWSGGE